MIHHRFKHQDQKLQISLAQYGFSVKKQFGSTEMCRGFVTIRLLYVKQSPKYKCTGIFFSISLNCPHFAAQVSIFYTLICPLNPLKMSFAEYKNSFEFSHTISNKWTHHLSILVYVSSKTNF